MAEFFDPNDTDFVAQSQKLARQRKLAELLRKRAEAAEMPSGNMVSGIYVKPSIFQQLAPLVEQYQARKTEDETARAEEDLARRLGQATKAWDESMPRSTPATPSVNNFVMQQMPGDDMPERSLSAPAVPLDEGRVLKHALAGQRLPGNESRAATYLTSALAGIKREDDQRFRQEESAANRTSKREEVIMTLQQRADEARMKAEERGLDREAQEAWRKRADDTQRYIAQLGHEGRMADIAARRELGKDQIAARRAMKLNTKEMNDLDAYEASASGLSKAIAALDKSSGDGMGITAGVVKNIMPLSSGDAVVNKFRDEATKNAIQELKFWTDAIRHDRFGATFTGPEKQEAMTYLPSDFDDIKETRRKAAGLQKVLESHHMRLRRKAGELPDTPTIRVNSQAEVDKLAPGTEFIGADGKVYRKN